MCGMMVYELVLPKWLYFLNVSVQNDERKVNLSAIKMVLKYL